MVVKPGVEVQSENRTETVSNVDFTAGQPFLPPLAL